MEAGSLATQTVEHIVTAENGRERMKPPNQKNLEIKHSLERRNSM